jgi:hypothetical protein
MRSNGGGSWAGGGKKDRSAIRVVRPWGFFAAKTPLRMTWYAIIGSKRLGGTPWGVGRSKRESEWMRRARVIAEGSGGSGFLGGRQAEGRVRDRSGRPWGFFAARTLLRMTWYAIIGSKRLAGTRGDMLRRRWSGRLEKTWGGITGWERPERLRVESSERKASRSGFGERGLSRKDPAEGGFLDGAQEEGRERDPIRMTWGRIGIAVRGKKQIAGGACPRGPGMVPSGIQNFLYKERVRGNDCPWLARDGSPEA